MCAKCVGQRGGLSDSVNDNPLS